MTTTPLFPLHKDYSAVPTGIIPAWWLFNCRAVKEMERDLKALPAGGAIRHRKYITEFVKTLDGEWAYIVMDKRKQIIAKHHVYAKRESYDTVNDHYARMTEAFEKARSIVGAFLLSMGVTKANSVPVDFNDEAPLMSSTYKAFKRAPDMWISRIA